jgi:hypothetical protein
VLTEGVGKGSKRGKRLLKLLSITQHLLIDEQPDINFLLSKLELKFPLILADKYHIIFFFVEKDKKK